MARPTKQGLEYFPQDTDIHNDRKIRRLRKEFCGNGYLVYDYIKCLAYKENGYWLELNDELIFDVSDFLGCNITIEFVASVIEFCFVINLFNREKHVSQGILTSSGIQKRFLKAKRGGVIAAEMAVIAAETRVIAAETRINSQKLKNEAKNGLKSSIGSENIELIIAAETPVIAAETPVIAAETPVIAAETPVIAAESTQSKLKESKVNNNNDIIISKNDDEEEFLHKCKFYKGNWHLKEIPEICAHFFFLEKRFDIVRSDCLKVLSLYYLGKDKETTLEALKAWSKEFNSYLNRTNQRKTMEGPDGYPFHFYNWLGKQQEKLKTTPKEIKKQNIPKEKTVQEILAERGLIKGNGKEGG